MPKRRLLKTILLGASAAAGALAVSYPLLIPLAVGAIGFVSLLRWTFGLAGQLPVVQRRRFVVLLGVALVAGGAFASEPALAQSSGGGGPQFSLLLQKTQEVFEQCVLGGITGLQRLVGILFGAARVAVMFALVFALYKAWQEREEGQQFTHIVKGVLVIGALIIVVGAVEPFIVGDASSYCGAGGGG